jgi:hypothetical protein
MKMDKTIMLAGVVALVAILAVTFILNPFGGTSTSELKSPTTQTTETQPTEETTKENGEKTVKEKDPEDDIVYETAVYGTMLPDVQGDCKLYQNMITDKFQCFGLAGNYSSMATNDYRIAESETYFCRGTVYGCKLYQKVDFQ